MSKKIGIIGSGVVAQSLGKGFLKHGYDVKIGTRDTSKINDWLNGDGKGASAGSFDESAAYGDIVVLAVAGRHAKSALEMTGDENLNGKTVIDVTNPISEDAPEDGVLKFFTNFDNSLMEELQSSHPEANFVKSFSSVGSAFMVDPEFESKPTMFICGDNDQAKSEVNGILDQFGWESEDMGTAKAARAIEPLCILWCIPGFQKNQWSHAFKLLKK